MSNHLQDNFLTNLGYLSYWELQVKVPQAQPNTYEWVCVCGSQKEIGDITSWIVKNPEGATLGFGKIRFLQPEIQWDRVSRLLKYGTSIDMGIHFLNPLDDPDSLPHIPETEWIKGTIMEMGPVIYIPLQQLCEVISPWWEDAIVRYRERQGRDKARALLKGIYTNVHLRGHFNFKP